MPFVEGGIVVDAEPQQQAAPPMAQGGFVQGGIEVDPTPEDSYNKVLQYKAAQTDYTPSKQEFLDYLKVGKEKSIDLKGAAAAIGPGLAHIAALPYRLGEAIGDIYQPPEGATEGDVAAATFAETAIQAKLKAQSLYRGISASIVDKLDQLPLLIQSKEDRARMESMLDDIKYVDFLEKADIDRKLALANAPQEQRVPASQEFLQTYNIPQEAIGQAGLEVGGFLADPSSIAFAGGGKLASVMAKQAVAQIPRAAEMLRGAGERVSQLGRVPENLAGSLTAKVTGSPQMGQAVQEGISKGTTTIAVGEAAGIPITMNVPVLGTASQVIGATKGLGATMETVGEAGAASRGPALTPTQRGLLGAGERIAAAEGASSKARALGTALARSGLETPVKLAANILVPMTGAAAGGGLLAAMSGEEADAISAAIGSGAAFGAFEGGFKIAKAVESNVFNGARVRQTAVDDLNTRPTEVQFTYVDPVSGEQTSTIKDSEARATLYGRLNNKQLTKALSEIAGAESGGIEVIFHSDSDTVPTALQTVNYAGVSIGPKNIKSGRPTILINVDRATPEAIPHEILHAKITQDVISQLGSKVIESMIRSEESPNEATKFEKQFTEFATNYAEKIKKSGGAVISDQILTELRDGFDQSLQRAQRIEALKRITDEFSAYYTQEMLKGKDPKTMLPGRIPSFIELALNNAKEAVSERFTRRALQAGFDPVARSFYDANGRRIKIPWMEDAIKNLVTPKEGYEPTEQKVDINKMTKAQQNALIMARGYSDLFMTAPDGSIVRPLSKAELAAKTADVANRTMKVVESVPQADRTSVSGMDSKGNPVIEGRLSLAEADAVSKSGIFSPSTSRSLIDIAMGIRDGTLMEGKYWKVYGSTGKSGVFGESEKLFLPYGISINSKGGVNVKVVDWGKVQARMYKALTKPTYKNLFRNYDQAMSTLRDVYLKNIAEQNAAPSAEALGGGLEGAKKRNFFNEVMGAVPKQGDVMSNLPTAGYVANRKGGSVYQDLRIERLQNTNPTGAKIPWTGDMGEQSSYRRTQLNFQPAETIGETTVSTDQNGGYRILSKNGKFRLYGPDGSTAGIFDTEGQAKLKAEKDYATQARLQPEVDQQQRLPRNEGRQTAEAGRGDSALGRTQGREEGRQELGTVRQAGDVITPESPDVAKKVVSGDTSTLKDGELLGTFRFMPPDLIDKLAVTDQQRKAMRGKSGFAFVSDWADAGRPYVTRLGRKIDVLMGGMGYPFLPEISGKGAWAGTFSTMTDRVMDKIKATDGIGLVVLGGPESSASSRAFSRAFGEELSDSMSQNPKLKEKLDAIARDAREKLIEYRRGKDKSINVPEINNLDDWARLTQLERVGEETENGLTFEDRAFLVRTIGAHDNKKALGIRSWKDVLRNYNLQNKDFTPGQVVAVVQFSGAEPVRAETVGAKVHPSYEALIPGKAIGTLPQKTMIKDVFRKYFASEETEPPSFTRKVQTAMPEFVVGKGDMRFMPSSLTSRDINAIAAEVGGGDVKGGAKAFGAFMRSMRDKGITLRDVVKSYGITLSSIQRQELPVSTIKKNWPDAPFQEGTKVRPEDAFAQLLGTPEGQQYLNAAERGVFDEQAADAVVQKFRSFGFHNKLKEQMKTAVEQFYPKAQEIIDAVNSMPTDQFIDYVRNNFKGISYGKVGFWSGQLGRGDIPTFDSRQGKLVYGKEVPVTKQVLMEQKDRLTQLGINVPAEFKDFAQTLLHHEVWDRLNQSDTEHGPIKEAMLRFMPDYSGEHRAPQRDSGAPLDNLKGVYPDDVYGPNAAQYYGHSSGDATDKAAARIIQSTKGKPDAPVKVFRAIPKSIQSNEINPGDWITTIKSYAVDHGEGPLGGDYKILEKTVNAGDLYTNGDSIFEFGYDPKFMPETIQRDIGRNQDFANPPTDAEAVDALSSEKKAKFGAARSIKPGTQVAARIDIPAFLRTGKYVVAVHEPDGAAGGPGKVIGYDTVTRLQNPKFVVKPGVQRIYEGKSAKFPVATVDGKIMADRSIPADLENYVPVGMDPKEHAFFYDKRTDQPVIGGSESVSVGNTVFVKNPVYGDPSQFAFMPSPDSAMPGAYSFPGGYRALPGKAKGSLRLYGPAGSLIGIAASLDEAQRIIRKKAKQ